MGLLNGLKKVKRYIKLSDGYKLLSIWTSSQSVEMDDGSTLESNKPNWDDKYSKSEIDNKLSAIETNIDWKESVDTFADIASAYPDPQDGWTVNVKDTDYTYRYSGEEWVVISANAIPKATQSVDGLLTKEDKSSYDSAVTKKHEHMNKSVLDGITSEKVERWDESSTSSVTGVKGNKEENYRSGNVNITPADIGAVDKSGDTMTGALTAPTFHGNLEGTFHGMSDKQIFRAGVEYGFNNGLSEDTTTWTTPGCFAVWSACTGTPKEEPWGNLLVFPAQEGRILQIYYDWNDPDKVYHRTINGTTVRSWILFGSEDAKALFNEDTRTSNNYPSWYQETYPRRTVTEFKHCTRIGLDSSVAGDYCTLETSVPWSDSSAGYATQIAKTISGAIFTRTGTSGSTWGWWKRIYTDDMLKWSGLGLYMPNASCALPSSFNELEVVVRHKPNNRIYTGRIRRYDITSSEMNWLFNGHYYNSNDYGSINIAISLEKIRAVFLTYKGSLVDMSSGEYDYGVSYR